MIGIIGLLAIVYCYKKKRTNISVVNEVNIFEMEDAIYCTIDEEEPEASVQNAKPNHLYSTNQGERDSYLHPYIQLNPLTTTRKNVTQQLSPDQNNG